MAATMPEHDKADIPPLLAVVLFAAVAFFIRSWEGDLHGDPVHYAAIAKNILATGEWVVMQDEPGRLYANKPPLMFWLIAANFKLFGPGTYAARFWSCFFGAASCIVVFLLARETLDTHAGILAAVVLATMGGFLKNANDVRMDTLVALCTALSALGFVRAHLREKPQWLVVGGLAGGVALMAKAAAGAFPLALLIAALAIWRRRWLVSGWFFAALGLGALVAVPWHAAVVAREGELFTNVYFGGEATGTEVSVGSHLPGNLGENIVALLVRTLPWWPLALVAFWRWRRGDPRERLLLALAALWAALVVLAAAVPVKRYDRYVIPACPAVALLAAGGLWMLLPRRWGPKLPRAVVIIAVAVALLLALFPIKLHSYRCRGFVLARDLLERFEPGAKDLAFYAPGARPLDPHEPTDKNWGARAKAIYYLDRTIALFPSVQTLVESGRPFVMARPERRDDLHRGGFLQLLSLDKGYSLFARPEALHARP